MLGILRGFIGRYNNIAKGGFYSGNSTGHIKLCKTVVVKVTFLDRSRWRGDRRRDYPKLYLCRGPAACYIVGYSSIDKVITRKIRGSLIIITAKVSLGLGLVENYAVTGSAIGNSLGDLFKVELRLSRYFLTLIGDIRSRVGTKYR